MKTTKKVLSVFLSLLMVLTSISVAFVFTASADEDPLAVLAEALKSNTVKNLQYVSTGTGTSDTASTTTITLKTYEEYKEIASLLQKIDDAVKAGEVYKGHIDCIDSTQTCVHFGMLKDGLRDALVPSYLEEQDYIDYNVAALLSKVFYMPRAAYTHGGYTSDGITYPGNNSSSSKVKASITNTVSVKTDDYAGYIADKGSYENSIDVVLSTTYTLTMKSINYQTGSFIKTNHYHNAIDTSKPPVVASVVDTDRTNTLKGFNSYLEAIDYPYYTMDVLFAMQKNGELDGENGKYTEWLNKYAEIKGVVSEDLFPTFFAKSQDFLDLLKKCASAAKLEWFEEQAEGWVTWAAAHPDYGTFNYPKFDSLHDEGTLESDYQEFIVYYNEIFENGTQDMLDYLEANYPGFSQSYYVNFTDNVKAYVLRDYKEIADNVFELYNNTHGDLSEDEQV
ncbi:MAG: hypothetical protein J1E34_10100, partial [Oscillospiraceae bacterium]|nr:hypothetical protein [Oscillospiraceae bacterium]